MELDEIVNCNRCLALSLGLDSALHPPAPDNRPGLASQHTVSLRTVSTSTPTVVNMVSRWPSLDYCRPPGVPARPSSVVHAEMYSVKKNPRPIRNRTGTPIVGTTCSAVTGIGLPALGLVAKATTAITSAMPPITTPSALSAATRPLAVDSIFHHAFGANQIPTSGLGCLSAVR